MAGANAIFTVRLLRCLSRLTWTLTCAADSQGERMLTTPTSGWDDDKAMLGRWGLKGMGSFESTTVRMKEGKDALAKTNERKAAALAAASEAEVASV